MELFESHSQENLKDKDTLENQPLPERMRPQSINEFIGQEHLIGENSPLYRFFQNSSFPSILFWGPPGTGKTTLAYLVSQNIKSHFIKLSAVESGIKDVRQVIEVAKKYQKLSQRTLLFIDEIHRFNKSQQDILLEAVEKGYFTLIGATTENPSFELNPALLSRCNIYILKALSDQDLINIVENALKKDKTLSLYKIKVDEYDFLLRYAGGDGRSILKALETSFLFYKTEIQEKSGKNEEFVLNNDKFNISLQQNIVYYDKSGENHYDNISAMIKSLRGSDPDAALLWCAKMLNAGEDPKFIARRLVVFASEDIGNADPNALNVAINVFRAVEIIGMPECRINIGQGITYLALAPKSNASYYAIDKALAFVKKTTAEDLQVPFKLRNAPTKLMKNIGYGQDYRYPHHYEGAFLENENYFPENIAIQKFYEPTEYGLEKKIKERYYSLWKR